MTDYNSHQQSINDWFREKCAIVPRGTSKKRRRFKVIRIKVFDKNGESFKRMKVYDKP